MSATKPPDEALLRILKAHGVYDGKTSLYLQEDVEDFAAALLAWRSAHTSEAVWLTQMDGVAKIIQAIARTGPKGVYQFIDEQLDALRPTEDKPWEDAK